MIDWTRIEELRNEFGAEDFAEVADLFLSEVEEALDTLRGPGPAADGLASQLHFLKGASLNLGFADMAARCAEAEVMARNGQAESIDRDRICDAFATAKSAFSDWLSRADAA